MEAGKIVEYIDRQKILCAVVLEVKNTRLRLLTENDREVSIAANRLSHQSKTVLDLSMGRTKMVAELKETAERREALIDRIDIKGLWDVLNTEQEWINLPTMTQFIFSNSPTCDHESAVVRAFFHNRRYFKFNADSFFPYTEKQVRHLATQAEKEAKRDRTIREGSQWMSRIMKDEPSLVNVEATPTENPKEIIEILKSFFLFGKDANGYGIGKALLAKANIRDPEIIFKLLTRVGVWHPDENLDLLQHRVPMAFSQAVAAHAANLGKKDGGVNGQSHKKRRDLTDLSVLTIDGPSTLDFDDAISIEDRGDHHLLGVHIADVAHYVRKNDPVDKEALARASSVYMPDGKIPMVPEILGDDLCSLMAGKTRPAISLIIKLTPTGRTLGYEFFPSTIAVDRQLTYTDADEMAESDPRIALLHQIADRFRQRRLSQGAVQLTLPELSVWLDENAIPNLTRVDRESPGRMLISEIMILANWITAKFLSENQMPAVFRSQPEPKDRLFQGEGGSLFQNWMQRKCLSRFVLGTRAEHHSGLGLNAYVTATSPIRKYYDLITQRQIRAILGLEDPYTEEEIVRLMQMLDGPMSYVPRIQFRRNRYWLLKYLEAKIGQKEEAIVLSKRRNGYQILLPAYMVECFLPQSSGIRLKPEDVIQITIQQVNARKDDLTVFMG
ncbi:MAG: VacB/RNase II family 3'-5' exoribonuclease [Deltaproteobacteria bacterium]|nr:VacB/RNase II family 3'-5' exoribonuclease [Deltaproteobacteria bacterium]